MNGEKLMATRVLILQDTSDKMLDEIFRKKPTFKEIYPKIMELAGG